MDSLKRFSILEETSTAGDLMMLLRPPEKLTHLQWMQKYRYLAREASEDSGKFDPYFTPYFLATYAVLDVPFQKHELAWLKPAQFGYTELENNVIGKAIDTQAGSMIVAFPREASAKSYVNEKFTPMVSATPKLGDYFRGNRALSRQGWSMKRFIGGFIKFVTSGSPAALKSTSVPIAIQEEPDDVADDVKNQGNGIDLLRQRLKTFRFSVLLVGGTPTISGESQVAEAYDKSKKCVYLVPCHLCGERHELAFDNLKCPEDETLERKFYGKLRYEEAYYECPSCGGRWDDIQKNLNVRAALDFGFFGWEIRNPEAAMWGFRGNELMSPFAGSKFSVLMKDMLEAQYYERMGKPGKWIAFVNNRMGLPYSPEGTIQDVQELKDKALPYLEATVPKGGLVLTMGIDVQQNRFAVVCRAWGRNGNSWLVSFVEIFGVVDDRQHPVWSALESYVMKKFPYELNSEKAELYFRASAIGIDSGDGTRTALIYSWVKRMREQGVAVVATKGFSESEAKNEVFNIPDLSSSNYVKTLASRYGVAVFMIGTQKAKAEIYRKLMMSGDHDRMYSYRSVREDYYDQLISNIPTYRNGKKVYILKSGQHDEALDGEVICLHGAHSLYLQYWSAEQWDAQEALLLSSVKKPQNKPMAEDNTYGGFN